MKHVMLTCALFAAFASSRMTAQSADLTATVPFNFRVGSTTMPAGNYIIHESQGILRVNQVGGNRATVVLTLPASRSSAPSTGVLEFRCYGDTYFLSSVWGAQSKEGAALGKSSQEKEIAKRFSHDGVQTAALRTK